MIARMKPIGESVACVVDNGACFSVAERLARKDGFKRVYFANTWRGLYPGLSLYEIGSRWTKKTGQEGFSMKPKEGMSGVWITRSIFPIFDEIDVFVMPGVYHGPDADWLRRQGKAVWGPGMGEELELNREGAKRLMKRVGLPMGEFQTIIGLTNLKAFLKSQGYKGWHIKVSRLRGLLESFSAENFEALEGEIKHTLGQFADYCPFTVERTLKNKVELGLDLYTVRGEFPRQIQGGIEIKDVCYLGVVKPLKDFPEPLVRVNNALAQSFRDFGYIGAFSSECRIGKDKQPYPIDLTCRMPFPAGPASLEMYSNFPEIVHSGAHGILVDPVPLDKYVAEVNIRCGFFEQGNWVKVNGALENPQNVKISYAIQLDDEVWVLPQEPAQSHIGSVIGWGKTQEAAIKMCREFADKVTGYSIEIPVEAFDKAGEVLDEAKEMGVAMF